MRVPRIRLSELAEIQGGGTPNRKIPGYWNGSIPWATVKDLSGNVLESTLESITPAGVENCASTVFPPGRIIVATRMAVGRAAINRVPMAINQDLKALKCNDAVDPRFLMHFIIGQQRYFERHSKGATVKGITLDVLNQLRVPLPSIQEQRRIVDSVDKAEGAQRLWRQRSKCNGDLIQSAFLSFFGHPGDNEHRYPRKRIGDLIEPCSNVNPRAIANSNIQFRYVELGGVDGKLGRVVRVAHFMGKDAPSRARQVIKRGDVLVATVRPNLQGTALVGGNLDGILCSTGFCVIRIKAEIYPCYMYQLTRTKWFMEQLLAKVKGASYPAVSDREILSMKIPVPPLERQAKFRSLFEMGEKIGGWIEDGIECAEELRRALVLTAYAS